MKLFKQALLIIFMAVCIFACKQDSGSGTKALDIKNSTISPLLENYNNDKSQVNANTLIAGIMEQLSNNKFDKSSTISLLAKGYEVATESGLESRRVGFLYPLIKEDKNSKDNESRLAALANIFFDTKKEAAGNVLASGFIQSFPSSEHIEALKGRLTMGDKTVDNYILDLGKSIFDNPDQNGLNRLASTQYIDACQAHALAYPNSASSAEYLYKAAEVAKSIRSNQKALSLYDWILDEFPDYEKASTTLFIKGFIIDNELKNMELAKEVYQEFLDKYPDHDLADDVQFLRDNLGKSDEEIHKIIEQGKQK